MIRLAIVGSTTFAKDPEASLEAMRIIEEWLNVLQPDIVISGGATGIDSIAEAVAEMQGFSFQAHLPSNARWAPDGYKARNERIVEDCTHLLAIRHAGSTTYGSGWTADLADQSGKPVSRVTLGARTRPVPDTVPA